MINIINIIVAMDKNGVIGKDNDLPWRLPNDLKYFKSVTENHPIIMGRKTFESLPNGPLPNRTNIVLSGNPDWTKGDLSLEDIKKYKVCHAMSIEQALTATTTIKPRFIIGGAKVFELFMPYTNLLYITHISHEFDGDTYFPDINWDDWELISSKNGIIDEKNKYPHQFCVYKRR